MASERKITFTFDADKRRRIATFTGHISDEELLAAYAGLVDDPAFDPRADDLADLRGVDALPVSAAALRQLIEMFAPVDALGIPTRLAIVAAADATFGMSRMYELLRGDDVPEEIRVFRKYEDAVAWLDETSVRSR